MAWQRVPQMPLEKHKYSRSRLRHSQNPKNIETDWSFAKVKSMILFSKLVLMVSWLILEKFAKLKTLQSKKL